MPSSDRSFAIVTGASSGIGYHLARECAQNGFDLLVAADRPEIRKAAEDLRGLGAQVEALEVDLASGEGVDRLVEAAKGRPVDALLANAGHGLGKAFLDQDFDQVRDVIDTNITGTIYLVHKIGKAMRERGSGRILFTGSIAGLMPGATDTEFFARADMLDTKVGAGKKEDPADVAKVGFKAMMKGEDDVVAGLKNKLQATVANVTPATVLAEMHRHQAEPGSAKK